MMVIFGQYNKATKTVIAFGADYNADCQAENLTKFLNQVRTVCFGRDNGCLLFGPYKNFVAVKLTNNYSNNRPHDPHGFKEVVKIKYDAIKVVAGKFSNGTAVMMALLEAEPIPLTWANYCAMPPADKLWEERGGKLNKTILFLMNSKNNNAKKDLRLAYSQGNMTAYPSIIEGMAIYLLTQYPNKNSSN